MEIKKGDKVRVSEDTPKMYLRGWRTLFKCHESTVVCVEGDDAGITVGANEMVIPTKYLIKVDAEGKKEESKFDFSSPNWNYFEYANQPEHKVVVSEDSIRIALVKWAQYEADLAKELVLKIANKYNQPHEAAEEAVRTAKEVVKHLKAGQL